jgi:FemAB-related protein (PEP-CTERM system-associated)
MQIRVASDIDEKEWNSFTSGHPQVSPYHHFAWKKAIENAYGHQCFYLIAENPDKEIVGVLPTVSITPPLISGKLCALPFCDIGACLAIDETTEELLIKKAIDITSHRKLRTFEYRASQKISTGDETPEPLPKAHKVRMLLELPESSDTLLSNFKAKLRSQIKKSVKNGLTVELGRSDQLVDEFYDVFTCNMRDLGSPTHSKKWFSEIKNNYNEDMIISIIKHEGQPIGAGIVLFKGYMASIPWASTKREFNHLAPNMLLYWSLLQYSTDNGYKIFDFGRSSYEEGTFKFKKQWGAKPLLLIWQEFHKSGEKYISENNTNIAKISKIRPLIETIWKNLPLPLTITLGSKIRKHISL